MSLFLATLSSVVVVVLDLVEWSVPPSKKMGLELILRQPKLQITLLISTHYHYAGLKSSLTVSPLLLETISVSRVDGDRGLASVREYDLRV
jgi:hypothetical protein